MMIGEKILQLSFHDESETFPVSIFVPFSFCFICQFRTIPRALVRNLSHMLYRCSTLSPPTKEMLEFRLCVLPFDCISTNLQLLEPDKSVELTTIGCYKYYLYYFHHYHSNLTLWRRNYFFFNFNTPCI